MTLSKYESTDFGLPTADSASPNISKSSFWSQLASFGKSRHIEVQVFRVIPRFLGRKMISASPSSFLAWTFPVHSSLVLLAQGSIRLCFKADLQILLLWLTQGRINSGLMFDCQFYIT